MKHAVAVSYIRQLCCLGLGGHIIMPELLRALHAFIPSAHNQFHWADEQYQMRNVYCENGELRISAQSLYFQEIYNSEEVHTDKIEFSEAMRIGGGGGNPEQLPGFLLTKHFNELLRPSDIHCAIEAPIREHGRGLGCVVLYRGAGEKPFSDVDVMRLRSLIPYLAHGLRGTRDLRGEMAPSGESGTLIVDGQDKIVQFCPEGKRLLLLAMHFGRIARGAPSLDSPAIRRLFLNLRGILRGRPQPVPKLRQPHALGEFIFRAYPLGSSDGQPNGTIVVTIERYEPLPLKLMRNMSTLALTARQREVCLLLSYGYSHSMIAQRMHVSKHTATDYVRKIYDKLDVNGHEQLMKKLVSHSMH